MLSKHVLNTCNTISDVLLSGFGFFCEMRKDPSRQAGIIEPICTRLGPFRMWNVPDTVRARAKSTECGIPSICVAGRGGYIGSLYISCLRCRPGARGGPPRGLACPHCQAPAVGPGGEGCKREGRGGIDWLGDHRGIGRAI